MDRLTGGPNDNPRDFKDGEHEEFYSEILFIGGEQKFQTFHTF